jgi:hypothetical protein
VSIPIVIRITKLFIPNCGFPFDTGSVCNQANHHFLLPIQAFEKIASWKL